MTVHLISPSPVTDDDQLAVVTTYQGSMSLRIHAMGFLEIAAIATRAAIENKTAIDSITPSIIYAIRHSVELFVKYLITDLAETYPEHVKKPENSHKLSKLIDDAKASIVLVLDYEAEHNEHLGFDYCEWLADLEGIVEQVNIIDPDGQTSRYPTNRKGNPNWTGEIMVSVEQLMRFVRHTSACFMSYIQRCS